MDELDDLLKEKLDQMNPERVRRERFLDLIQQIESSGGKNVNHPTMRSGIHEGHRAIGGYGLMPNTVKELGKRMEREGSITPEIREIANIEDPQLMKAGLESRPEIEKVLAERLARKVLRKFPSEEQAAYSWNQGHNLSPEDIKKRDYENHPYVQKFKRLKKHFLGN